MMFPLLAGTLVLAVPQSSADAVQESRDLLEELSRRQGQLETMSADFTQYVKTPLMRKPIESKGALSYRRKPLCAVFATTTPRTSICRFDEESYQVYWPEREEAERFVFTGDDLTTALVRIIAPSGATEIEESFKIGGIRRPEGEVEVYEIPFAAKKESVARYMTELTLAIEAVSLTVREIRYTNRDQDKVRIVLTKHQVNPVIDREAFEARLPDGVALRTTEIRAEESDEDP